MMLKICGQKLVRCRAKILSQKIVVETDDITLDGHQLLIVTVPGLPVQERPCFKGNIAYQRLGMVTTQWMATRSV